MEKKGERRRRGAERWRCLPPPKRNPKRLSSREKEGRRFLERREGDWFLSRFQLLKNFELTTRQTSNDFKRSFIDGRVKFL